MSKGVLKVGLAVAGAALLFVPGAQGFAAGLLGQGLASAGIYATTAFSIASRVTTGLMLIGLESAASLLASKPPPVGGSVSQAIIDPNAAQPYVMGEGYVTGVERYRRSYGGNVDDVINPYLGLVHVFSGGGPVHSFQPYADQVQLTAGSWYDGWLTTTTQLGACPEASALLPTTFTGAPDLTGASKLSGQAAVFWAMKYDKEGKRFSAGVPQLGAYGKWVKVYDPRKDSTRPGGSGSHRIGVESTYEWSENPALHAATYAYGRWQNGKRVIGIGLPDSAIDWPVVMAWANTCDANGWKLFGRIFEPGDRNQNMADICAAGGGFPIKAGGMLSFHYWAPRVSLDTITEADLGEDEASVVATAPWRDRINTIIPKYRGQSDQNWEMVDGAAVSVSSYVTEDGEVKQLSWPWNLVKDVNQASQLSRYKIEDLREIQPIVLTCGPRLRAYRPGECLYLNIPRLGLATKAVIIKRRRDPARGTVTFTFMGETDGKHAFALGQTGTPPPTPGLAQTGQDRDTLVDSVLGLSRKTGVVTVGGPLPAASTSHVGDTHIADDGTIYERVPAGGITLGGYIVTLGGYRPTMAWTPSAQQPLRDTVIQADAAYLAANEAIDDLANLADDGVLSVNEKITKLVPDNARLEDKWASLSSLASSLGVSTASASAARSAWLTFLGGLTPAWNNTSAPTPVFRSSYNTARDDYDAALYALDQAVKGFVKSLADTAQATANAAVTAAAAANTAAAAANSELANIASDSVLSKGEKPAVILDVAAITGEQAGIDAQATSYGITTQKTAYDAAVSALTTYLAGLTTPSAWNDVAGDTTIVGSTFRTKFADVYATRQALLNAIATVAGQRAIWGGVSGSGGQPSGADVAGTINPGGGVGSGQVSTGAIVPNGVTDPLSQYVDTSVTCPSGAFVTLASVTLVANGSTVLVLATATIGFHYHPSSDDRIRVLRNGTAIYNAPITPWNIGGGTGSKGIYTLSINDTPSAGTTTYELQYLASDYTAPASNRGINIVQMKR